MKTYEYFFHCDVASAGGGEVVSVVAQLLVQRNSHGGVNAGGSAGERCRWRTDGVLHGVEPHAAEGAEALRPQRRREHRSSGWELRSRERNRERRSLASREQTEHEAR